MRFALILAGLSGIPALVYQVVWSRQVALAIGGQVEAISLVVVAFFGGLALGARVLGPLADRGTGWRLYGGLEIAAGLLALRSSALLTWLAAPGAADLSATARFGLAAAAVFPVTFLLIGADRG